MGFNRRNAILPRNAAIRSVRLMVLTQREIRPVSRSGRCGVEVHSKITGPNCSSRRIKSFLHSSDLHLGRAYGGFPETIQGRMREARHTVIARLAEAAWRVGTGDVLLAGDTFDAESPSPETLRHALRAMAAEGDQQWFLLPGNQDNLAASELWRRIRADGKRCQQPTFRPWS